MFSAALRLSSTSKCTRRGTASFFRLVSRTQWLTLSARAGDLVMPRKKQYNYLK